MKREKGKEEKTETLFAASPFSFFASSSLDRALVGCLFLLALSAPHSIAVSQGAWLLSMLLWVVRLFVRPRPPLWRTPVDVALLGFFTLTFLTALTSYDPEVSIGKLRAASLFTVVYVVAENVRGRRVLRGLALALVASCALNVVFTFGALAVGRGVKARELRQDGPLYAAGLREGDTVLAAEGLPVETPEELERAIGDASRAGQVTMRWESNKPACVSTEREACVRAYRSEALLPLLVVRDTALAGGTAAERLGLARWTKGRDERARGFFGHYTTYAEALQLIASLALGMFVALGRKWSMKGVLLGAALAGMCGALLLTVTRASWLGLLLSALTIAAVGARRRTLLIVAAIALPLAVAGLFVLQQKRRVGFLDAKDGSTAWRLMVYREALDLLVREPRHAAVGVGMDSIKRHYREWGLFDKGRQQWSHLHSTPLQLAVERGLLTLFAWLALVFLYARMLWRMARTGSGVDWLTRGLALGALGGLVGFLTSGLVHYNWGDSEVIMIFYFVMGLALAAERPARAEEREGAVREG
ncbi:MAG TPA: O-antigen ligase family protein [Pyrinomonadaceae bacterium]